MVLKTSLSVTAMLFLSDAPWVAGAPQANPEGVQTTTQTRTHMRRAALPCRYHKQLEPFPVWLGEAFEVGTQPAQAS